MSAALPPEMQEYAQALVRDADRLIEDIENLLGRRNSLWGSLNVMTGWHADDASDDELRAGEAAFEALEEQSRIGDVDLLLELAAGRLAARSGRLKAVEPVSTKRAYQRRRAIRGPLAEP